MILERKHERIQFNIDERLNFAKIKYHKIINKSNCKNLELKLLDKIKLLVNNNKRQRIIILIDRRNFNQQDIPKYDEKVTL